MNIVTSKSTPIPRLLAHLQTKAEREAQPLVLVDAGMELALIVVLGADLSASKLPALVEAVNGVERAEDGLEVNIDDAVFVILVQLDVLDWAKLGAECLAHVLTYAAIITIGIRLPIYIIYAAPSHYYARLFAKLSRLVFLCPHATSDVPDLLRLDFAAFIIERTCALGYLAHLDLQMCDDAIAVLSETLTLLVSHLGHHRFRLADLGAFGRPFVVLWLVVCVLYWHFRPLEAYRWC